MMFIINQRFKIVFIICFMWTGSFTHSCGTCLGEALQKVEKVSLSDCQNLVDHQFSSAMRQLVDLRCSFLITESEHSSISVANLCFTLLAGVFCCYHFGQFFESDLTVSEKMNVTVGAETVETVTEMEITPITPVFVEETSKPSEESEDDRECNEKQDTNPTVVEEIVASQKEEKIEDIKQSEQPKPTKKSKKEQKKAVEQVEEIIEAQPVSSVPEATVEKTTMVDMDSEGSVVNNATAEKPTLRAECGASSLDKPADVKKDEPSIGELTPPVTPSIGHEGQSNNPNSAALAPLVDAISLSTVSASSSGEIQSVLVDRRSYESSSSNKQSKINETKPMVFVGGISANTSPMELVTALKNQGYKVVVVPRIRYGVSFGFCPDLVLSEESEVKELLAKGRVWVKDRWVDIRPYVPKDVATAPVPIAAPDSTTSDNSSTTSPIYSPTHHFQQQQTQYIQQPYYPPSFAPVPFQTTFQPAFFPIADQNTYQSTPGCHYSNPSPPQGPMSTPMEPISNK
eukprot:UN25105